MYTVAVSGSRTFTDRRLVEKVCSRLLERGVRIIVGDAREGVDMMVRDELRYPLYHENVFRAFWERDGRKAGNRRNTRLVEAADELVAIFADGKYTSGTYDAVAKARKRGLVLHVYHEGQWFDRLYEATSSRPRAEPLSLWGAQRLAR